MNIWVIGRGYPTTENGMLGSFELEQAKLLARKGHVVSFLPLTLSFFNRNDPRGLRQFQDEGVLVFAYSHFYFPGKSGLYLEGFENRCWRRLFEYAQTKNGVPDLIHIHYPSMISSIHEIERFRLQGVKIFVTEHWSHVLLNTLKRHERDRLRYYASKVNCFICVGRSLMDAVKRQEDVTVPMELIPNIVSPVFFRKEKMRREESFTFICVGRLVPLKQFDIVISEFLKEFSGEKNVILKIVGGGEQRSMLERLAGDNPRIHFRGELSLEDDAAEVSMSDALISFSKYETFAMPVAEAWACGKPAVVSSESGIAPFVKDWNGILVSSFSPNELSHGMRTIFENYAQYSEQKISNYARSQFSDEVIYERLIDIYNRY